MHSKERRCWDHVIGCFVVSGQGKIPANATLVFEVELFDWTGEDLSEAKDGGIVRRVIEEGKGFDKPSEDSSVEGTSRPNKNLFPNFTRNVIL